MVSHPENGSDSPIGSDRDRGRHIQNIKPILFILKKLQSYLTWPQESCKTPLEVLN